MRIRRELWFGFSLMAIILAADRHLHAVEQHAATATSGCSCWR